MTTNSRQPPSDTDRSTLQSPLGLFVKASLGDLTASKLTTTSDLTIGGNAAVGGTSIFNQDTEVVGDGDVTEDVVVAGTITGTISDYTVVAGSYTATLAGVTNILGITTPNPTLQYLRLGDIVRVWSQTSPAISYDITALSTSSVLSCTLPIASSFTATTDASGSGTCFDVNAFPTNFNILRIDANPINNTVNLNGFYKDPGIDTMEPTAFMFTYIVK